MRRVAYGMWRSPFLRYLAVGGLAFAVDLGLLIVGRDLLGWDLWLATTVAFWVSVVVSFLLQKYFAFAGSSPDWHSAWKYGLLLAFNSLATVAIVWLADSLGVGYVLGKFASTGLITLWNFVAYKYWVFNRRVPRTEPS